MGRKLYFPVIGLPPGKVVQITEGGAAGTTAPQSLSNLNGVPANSLGVSNGLIRLNSNIKINHNNIPEGAVGSSSAPMLDGYTSILMGQPSTYTISNYDSFINYTLTAINGSVSRINHEITYTPPNSPGACGFILNGKTFNITAYGYNAVYKPTVISPVNGDINKPIDLSFTSSFLNITSGSDSHESSDWQIAINNTFTSIVAQVINSTTHKTSWSVTGLDNDTIYYVRVKHKATNYGYSEWSDPVSFTTQALVSYNIPAVGGVLIEGQEAIITIETSGVPDGTILYWSLDSGINPTATNSDFFSLSSGSFIVNNNTGVVNIATQADLLLEGNENYIFSVRTGSVIGSVVLSYSGTITDTSYTLAGTKSIATYNLHDSSKKVIIDEDNNILIAGVSLINGNYQQDGFTGLRYVLTLTKLNTNDEVDVTFGVNGSIYIAETNTSNVLLESYSTLVKYRDYIHIAGLHRNPVTNKIYITGSCGYNSFIFCCNDLGVRDSNVGTNGYYEFNFKSTEYSVYNNGFTRCITSTLLNNDLYLGVEVRAAEMLTYLKYTSVDLTSAIVDNSDITLIDTHNTFSNPISNINNVITKNGKHIGIYQGIYDNSANRKFKLINHLENITVDATALDAYELNSDPISIDVTPISDTLVSGGFIVLINTSNDVYVNSTNIILAAYNDNLTIRNTFGVNGIVNFNLPTSITMNARSVYMENDKIYVIGSSSPSPGSANSDKSFTIVSFNADGSINTSFGNNGISIVSINNNNNYGRSAIYSTSRNKLIVIGDTDVSIVGSPYENPHGKIGTAGQLLSEIGVVFLNNSGALV
jgi:hypothetical protein